MVIMTRELVENGELALIRKETHGKSKQTKRVPVFTSRMEKREYYKSVNHFDIRNVLDVKGFLKDIRANWNTYVSQVNRWIQKNPLKRLIVTGIFTVVLGYFASTSNAAFIEEYTYQVKSGERIENIATEHGVTVQAILDANGLSSIDGKKILLPKVQDRTVTATTLNVRSLPNTESSIIGKYKKGDVVKVSFVENGWAGILIEGRVCFVSADYLTKSKNEAFKNNNTNTKINSSVYVIKSGDTFMKIGKSLGVTVSSIQKLNPTVDSSKLKIGQKINIPTTAAKSTMYVTASSLRVRETASTNSAVLGSLKLNDRVFVTSSFNGWAQINFKGKAAFASLTYLTNNEPKNETIKNNNTNTKISSSVYVIKSGDTFTKIGKALGISVSSIQELNPTVDSSKLKIGQKITIPTTAESTINQIKVEAQIGGVDPQGTFRFITSNGSTYAAKASGDMLNELFELRGEIVTLRLEGKRGQHMTLVSLQ